VEAPAAEQLDRLREDVAGRGDVLEAHVEVEVPQGRRVPREEEEPDGQRAAAIYLAAPSFFASSSERTLPPFLLANASASSFHAKATSDAVAALPLPPAT